METTEKSSEEANSAACTDLENILQKLETLSNSMAHLACMYQCWFSWSIVFHTWNKWNIRFTKTLIGLQICKAYDITGALTVKRDRQIELFTPTVAHLILILSDVRPDSTMPLGREVQLKEMKHAYLVESLLWGKLYVLLWHV